MSAADHRILRRDPARFDEPPKSEAPAAQTAEASVAGPNSSERSAAPIVGQNVPSEKAFSTVRAKFGLLGHTLVEKVHHGTGLRLWEASRWGQTRVFSDWHSVIGFLAQIGG